MHWSWGKDLTIINFTSRSWYPFLTCFIQVVLSFLIFPSFLLFTQKTFSAKRKHQMGQSLIILIIIYKSLINIFGLALVVLAYFLQPLNLILFNENIFLIQVLPSSATLLPYLCYWLHFSQFWSKNTCYIFSFNFIACLFYLTYCLHHLSLIDIKLHCVLLKTYVDWMPNCALLTQSPLEFCGVW